MCHGIFLECNIRMGNAITSKHFRALTIALLGLLIIGAGLASDANAAGACTSEIQKAKNGAYEGCLVKMGNREFTVGAGQSSAEGCSQVCDIMAEMGGSGGRGGNSARASETIRQ